MRNVDLKNRHSHILSLLAVLLVMFFVSSSFDSGSVFAYEKKTQEIYPTNKNGERIDGNLPTYLIVWIADGQKQLQFGASTRLSYSLPDNSIGEIKDGYFNPKKAGHTEMTITAEETDEYKEAKYTLYVQVQKNLALEDLKMPGNGLLSKGGVQLEADWDRLGGNLEQVSVNPEIATIDDDHYITFHKAGNARFEFKVAEDDIWMKTNRVREIEIVDDRRVSEDDPGTSESATSNSDSGDAVQPLSIYNVKGGNNDGQNRREKPIKQSIKGKIQIAVPFGERVVLNQKAKTKLSYKSSNKHTATVSKAGVVKFKRPGSVKIYVTAAATSKYMAQKKTVIVYSSVISRPTLTTNIAPGRIRLIWGKIRGASGYELFVKYPSESKFTKAVTKNSKVKSVTHSGLAKGKVYEYKVRACVKVGKKKYYSPFSKTIKVRVK